MAIYLCQVCGHTMGRPLGRCIMCRAKSIEYFGDEKSPEFIKKRRALTGRHEPWSVQHSSFLVLALISAALAVGAVLMETAKSYTADKSGSRPAVAATGKSVH